jgi:Uma2 family endonuclease
MPEIAFRSETSVTAEDFERWVQERPMSDANRYELFDGRIVMTPPATLRHARIEAEIARLLANHVADARLGIVLGSSAGYVLPSGEILEPDCSYVSNARLASGPEPDPNRFVTIVPDLVVEILSPATARRDRTEKKDIYERSGVGEYWLVDLTANEVVVYHRGESGFTAPRAFTIGRIASEVLPDLAVDVERLFAM